MPLLLYFSGHCVLNVGNKLWAIGGSTLDEDGKEVPSGNIH